jgi:acyl carrier protein
MLLERLRRVQTPDTIWSMSAIESRIQRTFSELLKDRGVKVHDGLFKPETVLLDSGLDSLGFATLVAKLEAELGYDPFVLMDEPFYPRTYQEFIGIYEKYKDHAQP